MDTYRLLQKRNKNKNKKIKTLFVTQMYDIKVASK